MSESNRISDVLYMKNSNRQMQYDFVRSVAMLAVVLFHILGHISVEPFGMKWWIKTGLSLILSTSNGMFFLLSGKYNLIEKNASEPIRFYKKRTISVIVPFLICSGLCHLAETYALGANGSYIHALIQTFPSTHYWFVYELIGLLFWTPLFARAIKDIDMHNALILTAGALIIQACFVFCKNLGIYPGYEIPLMGWPVFYLVGSYADRLTEKWRKRVILAGGAALVTSLGQLRLIPDASQGLYDLSPRYFLMVMAAYYTLQMIPVLGWREKVVMLLSRNSYYVYLIHNTIIAFLFSESLGIYDLLKPQIGTVPYLVITFVLCMLISITIGSVIRKVLGYVFKNYSAM